MLKQFIAVALLFCLPVLPAQASVIKEIITFLDPEGGKAVIYTTTRSGYPNYRLSFLKEKDKKPDDHLQDYLYLNPPDYRWDLKDSVYDQLFFSSGDYAVMRREPIQGKIVKNDDGTLTYSNWDGNVDPNGHFGQWNMPDNYTQIAYVVVLPTGYDFTDYSANREGKWIKRGNTLAWYGHDVNDLVYKIGFSARGQDTFMQLREKLSGKDIDVRHDSDGVRVTLNETVLFASGSADLLEQGKQLLTAMLDSLQLKDGRLIIEGHTDNIPITGPLTKRFASNWELSAARSLAVVHYLEDTGIAGRNIEARAFAEHRPRASNATAEGRAQNRRIEVVIPR